MGKEERIEKTKKVSAKVEKDSYCTHMWPDRVGEQMLKLSPRDELKPSGLKGISDQQIEYHFETHYKGYVNKLNEIWEKLQNARARV